VLVLIVVGLAAGIITTGQRQGDTVRVPEGTAAGHVRIVGHLDRPVGGRGRWPEREPGVELSGRRRVSVLGGTGSVRVSVNGVRTKTIRVTGVPKLYTLVADAKGARALLTLDMSPGVQAYDFTFG
jgi:hypothetical protein